MSTVVIATMSLAGCTCNGAELMRGHAGLLKDMLQHNSIDQVVAKRTALKHGGVKTLAELAR